MKKIEIILLILVAIGLNAADWTLVRSGRPEAVILLPGEKNTKSAQLGALELQYHISKITGVILPIVRQSVPDKIILQVGGDSAGLNGDAHRIRFEGKRILLTGNDQLDYRPVDYTKPETFPATELTANGSLFAVYDFLENYCGVRFYFMEDADTFFPIRSTLNVQAKNRDFVSPMDAFRWVYDDDASTFSAKLTPRDRALWRLRWRMCDFYGRVNHNQYSIYFAHWSKAKRKRLASVFQGKREDLFAQGYQGKGHGIDHILKVNYPNDPDVPPQLCYSNLDTVRYYAKEVLTYASGKNVIGGWRNFWGDYPVSENRLPRFPGKPFFYPIQGGDTGGYCQCSRCTKRFSDHSEDNVSNNKFQFIADVATEVARHDPSAGVATLAYISTLAYPDAVQLPSNVSVQICLPIYSWWHPIAREKQYGEYRKWIDKEAQRRPLTLWTYLFSPHWDAEYHFGNYKPFPGLYPWKTGRIFQKFAKDGIRGWFTEVEMRYNALEAYVAARICYDPSLDPDRIIDEYFSLVFGEAAPAVKAFYMEIEQVYWNPANCPKKWLQDRKVLQGPKGVKHAFWSTGLWSPELNWAMGTPERMKRLSALLEEAKTKIRTPLEKKFLNRLIDGIWQPALEGYTEFKRMQIRKNDSPRTLRVNLSRDTGGQVDPIDFTTAAKTEKWQTLIGHETSSRCEVRAAADSSWLYLEFRDPDGADPEAAGKDDFEIFFSDRRKYPLYQIYVPSDGKIAQYRYRKMGSKTIQEPDDFGVRSTIRRDQKTWIVSLAIPRRNLPFHGQDLYLNFFRTKKDGNLAWNPIFTGRYLDGADTSGRLSIFPRTIQEEDFYCFKNGKLSGRIPDSGADNGRAAWMDGSAGWSLQYRDTMFPSGKYRILVRFRSEIAQPADVSTSLGIYDRKQRKIIVTKIIPATESVGSTYRTFDLGICEFDGDKSFFVGGLTPKTASGRLFVDSLTFIGVQP